MRAFFFFDGQNLFHAAKAAFGYTFPNYDPAKLSKHLCEARGWECKAVRLYTGVPPSDRDPARNRFWVAKGAAMGREGVEFISRPVRYRERDVPCDDGRVHKFVYPVEKGIDVRIALDVRRLAAEGKYDVLVIFSRDQDLNEVIDDVKKIAKEQRRFIHLFSAYPMSELTPNFHPIKGTKRLEVSREIYDACVDHRDYSRQMKPKPEDG